MKKIITFIVTAALSVGSTAFATTFSQGIYTATKTFLDHNPATTMTLAWDGTNYYTSSGGRLSSPYSKYDMTGNFIASSSPSPGIDFRSIFTDGGNHLLARGYSSSTIYEQTSFGNFHALTNLIGGTLDPQSAVVMNGAKTQYFANNNGVINHWDLSGHYLGSFNLNGFTGGQTYYPQGRGLAIAGDDLLTYYNGVLTAWNMSGDNLGSTTLVGAGTSFDSDFSYSYADGKFWVADFSHGMWRGYDVGLEDGAAPVPEPASCLLLGVGLFGLGIYGSRRNRK